MAMAVKSTLTLFLWGLWLAANAQVWDFATWSKVKAGGELVKKLELSVEQQVRLDENSTRVKESFTEVGIKYDLPKGFDVAAAYRLGFEPEQAGGLETVHRYNIDLSYSEKLWKIKAKLRSRFQHSPNASLFNERLEPNEDPIIVRFKLSVSYDDIKKWTPGLEYEVFVNTKALEGNLVNKFRYRAFLEYKISKRHEVGAFYMLQTAYGNGLPNFDSILGINYAYSWKRPKWGKKKKKGKKD